MNSYEYLAVEQRDGCVWLRLDRADKANALTVGMINRALKAALAEARAGIDEHRRTAGK
jgi:enoyl-CoA hydratase/carnithine racemase